MSDEKTQKPNLNYSWVWSLVAIIVITRFIYSWGSKEVNSTTNTPPKPQTIEQSNQEKRIANEKEDEAVNSLQENNNVNANKEATEKVKKYMYDNFGGAGDPKYKTSWYDLIKDIQVSLSDSNTVYIETNIYPDEEGRKVANTIAGAVLFTDVVNFSNVIVQGQNNMPLMNKYKP